MPAGAFTRPVGMHLAIVGTAHLQARDLDHGLELGNRSVDILARDQSSRAKDYVRVFNAALLPAPRTGPYANSSTEPARNSASPPDAAPGETSGGRGRKGR
ncbi:MAG TPA: hypothetical protein VIS09_00460 [Streptomyces sp.]